MDAPLVYVHPTVFPALTANSVQVIAMCEAFGRYSQSTYLAAFRDPVGSRGDPFRYYGVAKTFEIEWLSGKPKRGLRIFLTVRHLVRRFGRTWTCFTRVPTVAAVTSTLGVPTILELHDVPWSNLQRVALRFCTRSRHLLFLVAISEQLRAALSARGYARAGTVMVLSDGARVRDDRTKVDIRAVRIRLGLPTDRPVVGYAGSLKMDKGVHVLLRAADKLPLAQFVVVGGSPADELNRMRRDYPEVTFLGQIAPFEVADFLTACDVVTAPFVKAANLQRGRRSVAIHEFMSPLKIFEAMASGTPLVTSDLPVLREVLKEGQTCLMVRPGDSDALAEAIARLLEDRELASRLAHEARQDVKQYSWDGRAAAIVEAALRHVS